MTGNDEPARVAFSRRGLLFGAGAAVGLIAGGGAGAAVATQRAGATPTTDADGAPVAAAGATQAGVARPSTPQSMCVVVVGTCDLGRLRASLAALGEQILAVTDPDTRDVAVDGPGDLTVTVGLGARALGATARPDLAARVTMPPFAGDADLPASRLGGDLLLSVNATDPLVLEPVLAALTSRIAGWEARWSDLGFRGPADDGVSRNPFGYHDGIVRPRTDAELADNVWIADGPLAHGTICVVRRFQLDTAAFRALTPEARDAVMGRRQADGAPLTGGARDDDVDVAAKTPAGEYVLPQRAHARAAHPSFTGSDLMLRRSYSYRESAIDHGHLFVSFQRDVATFVKTQQRMDDGDDLMRFATPTATGAFAVLPGFDAARPLGSTLF